ncbi:MAG: hypothetical protein WC521_03530 [Bdellovibrionales bacterium]
MVSSSSVSPSASDSKRNILFGNAQDAILNVLTDTVVSAVGADDAYLTKPAEAFVDRLASRPNPKKNPGHWGHNKMGFNAL